MTREGEAVLGWLDMSRLPLQEVQAAGHRAIPKLSSSDDNFRSKETRSVGIVLLCLKTPYD